jgi:hypothetical protein
MPARQNSNLFRSEQVFLWDQIRFRRNQGVNEYPDKDFPAPETIPISLVMAGVSARVPVTAKAYGILHSKTTDTHNCSSPGT